MLSDETAASNGVIFQHACDILYQRMKQALPLSGGVLNGSAALDASLFVPALVNGSFACELFLKSLLPPSTSGHKLEALFSQLDSNIQLKLKNGTIGKMKQLDPAYCEASFQTDLNSNSNVFPEWRYFHEGNSHSAGIEFIVRFMRSLFEVVKEEKAKK